MVMAVGTDVFKNMAASLTKRELFAAMAMQGIMSDSEYGGDLEDACACSVRIADKLLEELEK